MKILALDHLHIYASDPVATLAFYQDVLDAEPLGSIPGGGGRRNNFVILGGQILAISAFPAGMEAKSAPDVGDGAVHSGFGVAHLGINVDDLDGYVRRLEDHGVHVHDFDGGTGPREAGVLRYVYFTAPDGVIVELTQYQLPSTYRPAIKLLDAMNRTIHRTKRVVTKTLLRLAPTG